ncbi:hypothetical protein QK342_05155 [Myroides odoratimimus]|uniref:hypothetical protein n=1 Tax=Myroides odoratimimus TaxID=76832 RepID=UPI00103C130F|nr:hypothetical protein [Myroides odoratimimus]QBK75751.1 hypothetical protein E0Z07_05155 [Myroides odoratimimus]WHT74461.1 hypothetical protein QK342_05155 [Myroides odoratimimus]WHU39043.1 hypothetical protein QNM93_05150 [Myroides odoratimimus]
MIRVSNALVCAMEFTSFRKKSTVSDDELLVAVARFERQLSQVEGIVYHTLVRNYDNEYANVLFATSMEVIKTLEAVIGNTKETQDFFSMVDISTVQVEYHEIRKPNFTVPSYFGCIENGKFSLKDTIQASTLLSASYAVEQAYLNAFENTKGHFISTRGDNQYAEIVLGHTLGNTKEICYGYFGNEACLSLLGLIDECSMHLGFWYVVG